MNLRIFDTESSRNVRAKRTSHVEWMQKLIRVHGQEQAIRITRGLAVDFHIGHKKQVEKNRLAGFYKSALAWALKRHGKSVGKTSEPIRAQARATEVSL